MLVISLERKSWVQLYSFGINIRLHFYTTEKMGISMYHTLVFSLVTVFAVLPAAKTQTNLTLAVFISAITDGLNSGEFSGNLNGRPFQIAVDLAVEAVNNHPEILNGYNLQAVYVDSQVTN